MDSSKKKRTIIIVIAVVAIALCSCSVICVVAGGGGLVTGVIKAKQERDDVAAVLDQFMREMEAKNVTEAFALFSARARRQMTVSDLEETIEGSNYILFSGYESITISSLSIKAAVNTNPNAPQGTIAEVVAAVAYEGDITGKLSCILEQEDGEWRLHHFSITVPPSKLDAP